jgi:hypothetical protein
VACCDRCGTGFADVEPNERYYAQYYATLAKYAIDAEGDDASGPAEAPWEAAKADLMAHQIIEFLGGTEYSFLDVGCAGGSLLGGLERLGCRSLTGVDPSPDAVTAANRRPSVTAHVGSLPKLSASLGKFDCICLTGVLEHLWNPDIALRSLIPLCHEKTVIWAEVPDAARYLRPYLSPYEDFSTEHVNHFSARSLDKLGTRVDLKAIHSHSYLAPLTSNVETAVAAVVWAVSPSESTSVAFDTDLAETLMSYSERSAKDFSHVVDALERGLSGASSYVLWGVGEYAFKLLALEPLSTRKAHALVDRNRARHALRFDGEPVRDPSELVSSDIPVVAGSLLQADVIARAARDLGLANPVITLDQTRSRSSDQGVS